MFWGGPSMSESETQRYRLDACNQSGKISAIPLEIIQISQH